MFFAFAYKILIYSFKAFSCNSLYLVAMNSQMVVFGALQLLGPCSYLIGCFHDRNSNLCLVWFKTLC